MIAICKREFASLFNNVIGWLFVGVMVAMYGLYFFLYNMLYGLPQISHTLSAVTFLFLIAVPVLTMRILSEDRRNRTDQLIMTAPVSTWQIVLGKYLALVLVFAIPVCLMAVSPLILGLFGEANYTGSFLALLGFVLYGLLTLSVGLFVSSLTESVVISAIVSFVLLFLGYMMPSITGAVFPDGGIIPTILGAYDFITPMDDLSDGSLNLRSIIYYVSVTGLFLFGTVQSIEKRRWSVSVRKLSGSVFSITTIAVVCAAVAGVNALALQIPDSQAIIDMTAEKYFSLTKDTVKFLKDYSEDVTIYVVGTKKSVKESSVEIPKTLKRYHEANPRIKISYVNISKNPTFLASYDAEGEQEGSLIVVSDKRSKVIPVSDIYPSEIDYTTYSQTVTGYDGEGQITSALQYVSTDDVPVVYILEGHDELAIGEDFMDVLEKSNYEIKQLSFLKEEAVPEDSAALIINGVQSDLSDDDVKKVVDYINDGGSVLASMDFLQMDNLARYKGILSEYGITPVEGVVAELDKDYYYQNPYYLLPEVEVSDATDGLEGKSSIFSPFSVGLEYNEDNDNTYTKLFVTSDKATSKKGYGSAEEMAKVASVQTEVTKDPGDPDGPFSVGLLTETKKGGKIIVLGSAYLLTDASDAMVSYRNSRLFDSMMKVLVPDLENENGVIIPVKKYDETRLTVNTNAAQMYGFIFIVLLPVSCLVAGVVIWSKRRRR